VKIRVHRELCSGHARCFSAAPSLYKLDAEGYTAIQDFDVAPGEEALASSGAWACPERALEVVEEGPADSGTVRR
jgi:ferredoxin